MDDSQISLLLQILIPIIQFFILLIPFIGSKALFDKRRKWYKKFSTRGYILGSLGIVLIFLTIYQNQVTERITSDNQDRANKILAKRDSVYRRENRVENLNVVKLLASYGFEVKLRNEKIEKILKDSTIRKSTTYNAPDPNLLMETAEIIKDSNNQLKIKFSFTSKDASTYDINAKIDILYLTKHSNKILYLKRNIKPFIDNYKLAKDYNIYPIITIQKPDFYKSIIFYLTGNYKKSIGDASKIELSEFNLYDPTMEGPNKFGVPGQELLNLIKETIKNDKK